MRLVGIENILKRRRRIPFLWQIFWSMIGGTIVAFLLVAVFLNSESGREVLFCPFVNESLERVEKEGVDKASLKMKFSEAVPVSPVGWVKVESAGIPLILPAGRWRFHGDSVYLQSDKDDRLLIMPIKEVGDFLSFVRKFPGVRDIKNEYELMDNMFSRDLSERCKLLHTGSEIFVRFALIEPKSVIASQGLGWVRKAPGVIWWYQKTRGLQNFGWIHIMLQESNLHLIVMSRRPELIASAPSLIFAKTVGFQSLGIVEKDLVKRIEKIYPLQVPGE
jgi:hypothetical protein